MKRELEYTVGGKINWCSHDEKSMKVPKKPKTTTILSRNYNSRYTSEENENTELKRYMHHNIHSYLQ